MATAGVRIYPTDDMTSRRNFGAGGPSVSRQSASEMFQYSSPQSREIRQSSETRNFNSVTLEEAYWTERRRKIGLPRHIKNTDPKDNEYQRMREEQILFVKKHFNQKECRLFVPVPGQTGNGMKCKVKLLKCHCGEVLSMHAGMRMRSSVMQYENCFLVPQEFASVMNDPERVVTQPLPVSTPWTEEYLQKSPTNAFGKVTFNVEQIGGKKPAKYIRLCKDDSVDDCMELMQRFWRIMEPEPPNLVISVVGGAKNFKLDGRMRDTFSNGLIKAAKTTSAWLLTSGFNMGVMKAVGQAVHEGQTFQWDNDRMTHVLRCIGIAPWGYVKGRNFLESSNGTGKFNAYYRTSSQILHKQPVPLNADHTHFIFVDDGHRIRYGGVAEFRSKFERKIFSPIEEGGLGIPLVVVVVEGGTDAIEDVSASLKQGVPVVVCAGTGRAADILTYAFNHTTTTHNKERVMSEYHQDKLARKIYAAYKSNLKPGREREELEKLMNKVIGCCKREDLMTIFNMNKHEDLDLAILSVLLKVDTNSSRESQLQLAMTWNRADIAQEEIFREDVNWKDGSLDDIFTQALEENKVEFVKLLLNNGIIMREYLTLERLEHLYNSMPKHNYLYVLLKAFTKSDSFSANDIGSFLQIVLDKYDDEKFTANQKSRFKSKKRSTSFARRNNFDTDTDVDDEPSKFKRPYKQLLIWAVLLNRPQLARLFWELGEEPITSALVVTRLCREMAFRLPKYLLFIRDSFQQTKNQFEQLAIEVLDECHSKDPDKAMMLVERKSPCWSKMTCLQIAAASSDQAFLSSVASQSSINNVWKSGIISRWPKVLTGVLIPVLIIWIIDISKMGRDYISKTQKFLTFYSAPMTKFGVFCVAYMAFLVLFTYMLLVDFKDEPSISEWILIIWILSYFIGGIHTFIVFPSPTFSGKVRDHFGFLDRIEMLNLLLALFAFCFRWSFMYEVKRIYCINVVIFYICVIKLYTANSTLGPKIYMIYRMMSELIMFVMVLMVFLLSYGVASQGLLYKHRDRSWLILKDILYFPYWQIYGEIFLEEIETDTVCTDSLMSAMNGTIPDHLNTCRTFHWLVPFLLAAYLLIGNVLLLNLLIAIFSHVFDTVEKNAIEIWKFQMYFLVMEFQNRPTLCPPFSIISYILYLFKWLYMLISCKEKEKTEQFLKHHLEYLGVFEKEMMANKLRLLKANIMQTMEMKFSVLQTRMDELTRVIEDELIAEQYNMMPTLAAENTMFAELGMNTCPIDQAPAVKVMDTQDNDLQGDSESLQPEKKKKHKHKKKKRKDRDQDVYTLETLEEEKQLNINVPGKEKKSIEDKKAMISDEENKFPAASQKDLQPLPLQPLPGVRTTSATPPLPPLTIDFSSTSVHSPGTKSNSPRMQGQTSRSPVLSVPQRFSFPEPLSDSDEDPIPLNIYHPRASNLTMSSLKNTLSPIGSDDSSGSNVSYQQPRRRKVRRHLQRRGPTNENLQDRLERVSRSNRFSTHML